MGVVASGLGAYGRSVTGFLCPNAPLPNEGDGAFAFYVLTLVGMFPVAREKRTLVLINFGGGIGRGYNSKKQSFARKWYSCLIAP